MAAGAREISGIPFNGTSVPILRGGGEICKTVYKVK